MLRRRAGLGSVFVLCAAAATAAQGPDYRALPGGTLRTVLPPDGKSAPALVDAYRLRSEPVTNAEFLAFVTAHPQWRKGSIATLFADSQYLSHWAGPTTLGPHAAPDEPVTRVSWYAARAYCAAEQARLPLWHEWEFAAAADETRTDARNDPRWRERILGWYSTPAQGDLPPIGNSAANVYGVRDMHGLVWEWVDDYAALMVSADNREQGDPDLLKFCGAGALSTQDRDNYAILMRVAMLSALKAADTTRRLGFRCARDGAKDLP